MYAQEFAPRRGGAAVMAVAIHGVLIYGLAIGLGVAPKVSLPEAFTVVEVPEIPVEQTPSEPRFDPNAAGESVSLQPPTLTKIVIDDKKEPVIGEPIEIGPDEPPRRPEPMLIQARILRSPEPPYPDASRRIGEEGAVYVRIDLGADGRIMAVRLEQSSGYSRLDEAALKAVRGWRFAPANRAGQGVSTSVVVPVKFELHQ